MVTTKRMRIQKMEHEGRIADDVALHNPAYKVNTASDLGKSDSTAVWFWQDTPEGVQIIDYHEAAGWEIADWCDLYDQKGYDYDEIWLPHDAKAKTMATKKSTVEQFRDHFSRYHPDACLNLVPKLAVQHGIDAVRAVLPSVYINKTKCYDGIEALRAYRRSYNELTKAFLEKPVHDWASDGADGFRYLSLVCKDKHQIADAQPQELIKRPSYTLDKLWEDREAPNHRFQKMRI